MFCYITNYKSGTDICKYVEGTKVEFKKGVLKIGDKEFKLHHPIRITKEDEQKPKEIDADSKPDVGSKNSLVYWNK